MRTLHYKVLLRKEKDGTYTVIVPSLPGCLTFGRTVEEAIAMAKEAIEGLLPAWSHAARKFQSRSMFLKEKTKYLDFGDLCRKENI